ncbi:MAG: dTDP-4-dehydrorhamnose 3,5-epimerase, partial [uncultured Frankineae bacterium]
DHHDDRPRRTGDHRPRAPRGRPRLLRAQLRPGRVRRGRPGARGRAVQRVVQPPRRDAARHALPGRSGDGGQAGALHRRGGARHRRGRAGGLADLPAARRGRADRREPALAVRPADVRARLPDPRGRRRGHLPGQRGLHPRHGARPAPRRPGARPVVAVAGQHHLGQGRLLAAADGACV